MYIFLAFIFLVLLGCTVWMYHRLSVLRLGNKQLQTLVECQDGYTFLLNRKLEVVQTNFYNQQWQHLGASNLLGNVLHCKNAHDAGQCGEHDVCKKCPVRFVITKAFERGVSFHNLEACMELLGDDNNITDTDVQVDGHFVKLNNKAHMVVNVKLMPEDKLVELPKLLFISEKVDLFLRVKEALGANIRVLNADNLHQALHRLLMVKAYGFLAILIDEEFYEKHEEITKLLVKNDSVKVIVFTSNNKPSTDGHVFYLSEHFDAMQLRLLLLDKELVLQK